MNKTVYLNNLVKNSSFEVESGWTAVDTAMVTFTYDTVQHLTGSKSLKAVPHRVYSWIYSNIFSLPINHLYYMSVYYKKSGGGHTRYGLHNRSADISLSLPMINSDTNTWIKVSEVGINTTNIDSFNFLVYGAGDEYNAGMICYFDDCLVIDLTACFGYGNEPDQAWCDANIPYFETEMAITIPDTTTEKTTTFVDVYNSDYISLVKAPVIKPKFKIELLDLYENTIGEITKDISADNSGSISINYQQGVRRSCSFTLSDTFGKYRPMSNDNIFGFNTKFKIYVGLENIQTGETYWFSQGIFYTTNPTSSHANSNKTVTVNGVDKFGIFTSDTGYNQLEGTYIVPAKSKLYAVVKDILSLELGNGYMIDPKEPHIDAEFIDYELPYDIKKSPGSYMGDILIELGNVLGADIFYDTNGILNITSGTTDITYSKQSSIWDFSDVLPEYSNGSVSLNTIDAINIVKVVGNQVNDSEIYIGNAENHNPLSPTAIEKIGRKIYYEESANLPNQVRADEYAKYVLNSKSIIQTAIGFSSTLIPHLDVNRVITITDDYYKYEQERFIIQSITMPLDSKTLMSISCNNIASLPYYDLRNGG